MRDALVRHGYSLFLRGLSSGASGNMSVLLPDGTVLVTPCDCSFGRLEAGRLSRVRLSGERVSGPGPSRELACHLPCYNASPACMAVVHLHTPYATALSCVHGLDSQDCLPPLSVHFAQHIGRLPLVPYCSPDSLELKEHLTRLAPTHSAALLTNHGPLAWGASLDEAVKTIEELEASARLFFILQGQATRTLSAEEYAALRGRG